MPAQRIRLRLRKMPTEPDLQGSELLASLYRERRAILARINVADGIAVEIAVRTLHADVRLFTRTHDTDTELVALTKSVRRLKNNALYYTRSMHEFHSTDRRFDMLKDKYKDETAYIQCNGSSHGYQENLRTLGKAEAERLSLHEKLAHAAIDVVSDLETCRGRFADIKDRFEQAAAQVSVSSCSNVLRYAQYYRCGQYESTTLLTCDSTPPTSL